MTLPLIAMILVLPWTAELHSPLLGYKRNQLSGTDLDAGTQVWKIQHSQELAAVHPTLLPPQWLCTH